MIPKKARQVLITAGLVAIIVAGLVLAREDAPANGGLPPSNERSAGAGASPRNVPVVDVRLELLHSARAPLGEAARNPFRFQARVAPPAPRPAARGTPKAPVVGPGAPDVPAGPPPPPPIPLRFIGLVDAPRQGGRVAILSDGRGNVFYGKEGDIIEGRYKVLKIGPEAAELSYSDGRGRQTIRLSGQ